MSSYIPDRADVVWLDFEPKKGKEIGKYRPALILSSKAYAKKTGMVICSPISTSIRGGLTEVHIDGLDKPSVVAAAIVNTLSYKSRKAKLITQASKDVVDEVLSKLLPLMGNNP
ncbi:MAG: MazF family transcriptional regulator [Candidatus Thioglobus sp.]|jgi:mRNA interferase MazF|nr:MazF family transcriptional regulator [Candidatus Thioglobus sp.]MBT6328092.1 MazF family transcriptional regulator [Candidatus Thioglobus sp.]